MDLPTPRELELETLLRQRDAHVTQLDDEVARLRRYLIAQPAPPPTEPVSLPPALTALLLPHLPPAPDSSSAPHGTGTAALTQRARLLLEENDELYQLLKQGETGKLKEEVRGLRRLVERLQGALRESHQVVQSLSTELDKAYEALLTAAPRANKSSHSHSRSPRNSYHPLPAGNGSGSGTSANKLPPTGPRAHKRPRLSEPARASPPPPPKSNARVPSPQKAAAAGPARMDVDEAQPAPRADRGKEATGPGPGRRERDRERERRDGRDRERPRHNGNFSGRGGGGGGGGRRADRAADRVAAAEHNSLGGVDRTLKERMGL